MREREAPDDSELIEAARGGDSRAFEALYLRHRDFVLRVAARFGAAGPDALDVLQETFLYFLRALPGFELRARFTTFLYPAAKHLALKKRAAAARFASLDESPPPPFAKGEKGGLPGPAGAPSVAEIAASLPEGQREVVLLRFVDGMSLEEIAAALGIPVGTVKSRLHHALSALRREST